ncbi:MAG: 2-C-methyl-D-erythritol 4-phosphate cytidylyltransferase [Muribaculum sp.]|nr:2-C-methyl-D-erythritol 4-phosphate cytidylyltransferase [Muribaculum sp.]
MKKFLILLAGGEGRRAGGSVPKQLMPLGGRPLLWHSMKRFKEADPQTKIILVMHPGLFVDWDVAFDALASADRMDYTLCCGGRSRTESVANGLITLQEIMQSEHLNPEDIMVAVHDAARPLVPIDVILRVWQSVSPGVCAVPAVACSSSLRRVDDQGESQPVDRAKYREVQTPQAAMAKDMICSYRNHPEGEYTDDASLMQACGLKVILTEGSPLNIKVTYPLDIHIAETLLKKLGYTGGQQ